LLHNGVSHRQWAKTKRDVVSFGSPDGPTCGDVWCLRLLCSVMRGFENVLF